jgi:hypothetical protein
MRDTALQEIRLVLEELQLSQYYLAFCNDAPDSRFHEFRLAVEKVGIRCFELPPNEATAYEIRQGLENLRSFCNARLIHFLDYIQRAQAVLGR